MNDNFDKRFDELMRDAAKTYRVPPEAPIDEMWASIEAQLPGARPVLAATPLEVPARRRFASPNWFAIAATLLVGIGIGRATTVFNRAPELGTPVTVASNTTAPSTSRAEPASAPYDVETSRYLGQAAALLIALPTETKGGKPADAKFISRAGDLLTTTRMLIDSPASRDPAMRNLLEDLELVLARVVRLENNHDRLELDLINRALEQRDVIPRLRTAVADISAN